jgi:hypothetical protein
VTFITSVVGIMYLVTFGIILNAAQANDSLIITSGTSPIKVDGDISDWSHIPFTKNFILHDTGSISTQNTKAKVAMDENNIYFAFDVKDKNIVATNQVHDGQLFTSDDLIEVFIDFDGDGENYLEFGVNAHGTIYDYVLKCVTESCGGWADNKDFTINNIAVKTSVLGSINNNNDVDEGFIVEVKLPFKSLQLIKNGNFTQPIVNSEWRVNMFRIDYGTSPTEYQSWVPHNSFGFHQPDKFGYFYFKM